MRILVTGASGFIGSHMIAFLKQKGHFVRGVSKSLRKDRKELFTQADELLMYDMRDLRSVILACRDIDYVIHLSADMGGVGYFHEHDFTPFFNNITMDMNVLQAAEMMKVKRLFYASSACIYPTYLQMEEGKPPKLSEDMIFPASSDQMYGWEKLMMTMLCQRSPLDARVGIFHTIFGPYQETEGERMKFPTAIVTKALQAKKDGKPIEIWGDGKQIRSFLYIDDALEKIYRVLMGDEYPGPVNIGSDDAVTVEEVAKMCCEIVGIKPRFTYTNMKPSGVLARNCDNSLFEEYYSYKNKVSTREGFRRLIEWVEQKA